MATSLWNDVQVFDPKQEYHVIERRLPHWTQPGTICFITFRLWDSIPEQVRNRWLHERWDFLRRHEIDPHSPSWRDDLERLDPAIANDFQARAATRWNNDLDACHVECVLRQPDLAAIVADSLLHFDGQRYDMTDFVVMPNHVHLLVAFPDEESMLTQCDSWKHFTATKINRLLKRNRRFWQQDGFDHLVRSIESFEHYRRYISDNPRRAKLRAGEFIHFSKS